MKGISYLLCLIFIAPLLTGCFGNNNEIEHDEALVGNWYIADEVVISFYSNGTVVGDEGQQGTWSTETKRTWDVYNLMLDLKWPKHTHNRLYYTVNDGWLVVLQDQEESMYECGAVSKYSISVEDWNTSIENLGKLAIEPQLGKACGENDLYGDLYLLRAENATH
jgi:hypothetical protein